MGWFVLALVFWKPLYWTGKGVYHLIRKEDWSREQYWSQVKGWFNQVWDLVRPSSGDL